MACFGLQKATTTEKPSPIQSNVFSNKQSASSSKRFKNAYSQPTLNSSVKKKTAEEMVAKVLAVGSFP